MFLVLKSETSKSITNASTRTRKYLKGPDGRLMGPQTLPCSLWSFGGSFIGNFHRDGHWITLPCEHAMQLPTLLALVGQTACPMSIGNMRWNILSPWCPNLLCHNPTLIMEKIKRVGYLIRFPLVEPVALLNILKSLVPTCVVASKRNPCLSSNAWSPFTSMWICISYKPLAPACAVARICGPCLSSNASSPFLSEMRI